MQVEPHEVGQHISPEGHSSGHSVQTPAES